MGRTKGENVGDLPVRDLVLIDWLPRVQDEICARIDETGLLGRRPLHLRPPRSVRDNPNALSALRRSAHLLWSVLLRLRPLHALAPLNGHVPGKVEGLGCEQYPKVMILTTVVRIFIYLGS